MPRLLIIICFLCAALSARGQTYNELRVHLLAEEGYSATPYLLRGVYHIGLGHRIVGNVPRKLTSRQIERLFAADLKIACDTAYQSTRQFSSHPKQVRIILISLSYNVGSQGYRDFVRFRAAIDRFDYKAAARELDDSLWSTQVPNRAARYINILNNL